MSTNYEENPVRHIVGAAFSCKEVYLPKSSIDSATARFADHFEERENTVVHLVQYANADYSLGDHHLRIAESVDIDTTLSTAIDSDGNSTTLSGHLKDHPPASGDKVVIITPIALPQKDKDTLTAVFNKTPANVSVQVLAVIDHLKTADLCMFTSDDDHKFTYSNGHVYAEPRKE